MCYTEAMIEVDGNYGEGGGQILRTAVGLSAAIKKPCGVFNIRKRRKKPGLMRSHLAFLKAAAALTSGRLEGAELNSSSITFFPGTIKTKEVGVKIKTAGSITLVLQGLLFPSLVSKEKVKIKFNGGATDTFFSPTIDHLRFVFFKTIEKMGVGLDIKIQKRGFYPKGNAQVTAESKPFKASKLKPVRLTEPGELEKVHIISGASYDLRKKKVAERQVSGIKQILSKLNLPLEEKIEYYDCQSTGSQVNIIAQLKNTVFGTDNLGKLGKSAEQVGKEAALRFLKEVRSQACLDRHTSDQVLPYMAFSEEKSQIKTSEVTPHCRTNMWVIEKFLEGRFKTKQNIITWLPS